MMYRLRHPPSIDVSLTMNQTDFLLNSEPVTIDNITLENTGADDIIVKDGFSEKDFRLLLTFTGPDGEIIKAGEEFMDRW